MVVIREKILISACLLGQPVRYNGKAKTLHHALLDQWQTEGRVVSVCPELKGGFSVPRLPAEIGAAQTGEAVLAGDAKVVALDGEDVTALFIKGAQIALDVAKANHCRFALLIDGSPSCGSAFIYDGSFGNQKHVGNGVTAALLRQNGIEVFADHQIELLQKRLLS
ncbi:uncharacterized protein YbbK (DUF523 family) [Paenochrobactrum gallinarii]|uniref:Uncharacterized protein YbbK (DUF523 family) n=1 Tax=Paenochrobactrum gallinarii TaxID=643673 RepID=A0A841LWZ5_9HYPH|nr:DUF523 domain-containing protein [Paenochrobactrum gallinarii]MBB6261380.1 uncharacterized protein YbbK (DUF523 family) [Paenochrobactrum gallinarii]